MRIVALFIKLLLQLPDWAKLKLAGGTTIEIAGRKLDLDNQFLCTNNNRGIQMDDLAPTRARSFFKLVTKTVKGQLSRNVSCSHHNIVLRDGSHIRARLYTPCTLAGESPLLLFFHGGGNVIGDLDSYDPCCGDFCEHLNIRVLSVDYRLAPEHKYPTAALDAFDAYAWVRGNHHNLEIDPSKIIVSGDSAGGYLSTVVCLQALEQQQELPAAQVLIYPMTDMSQERESYELFGKGLVLTKSMMDYFIGHYLNNDQERFQAMASPLLASDTALKQMPKTILTLAGFDPLYDEGKAFYEKLKSLGVDIELIEHLDLTHGFITMTGALKKGREAHSEIAKAIQQCL